MPVEMAMKKAAEMLARGRISISECEKMIEDLIVEEMKKIEGFDERMKAYSKLKRKSWYMLLEVTRGFAK